MRDHGTKPGVRKRQAAVSQRVAVLIATCNRPGLLSQRSLTAVQRQTRRPDFLVVVDDSDLPNQSDNRNIVNDLRLGGAKIVYLTNTRTRGAAGAWNAGLDWLRRHAGDPNGVFVAVLDDDDEWDAEHLACCEAAVAAHGLDMAAASILRIIGDCSPRPQRPTSCATATLGSPFSRVESPITAIKGLLGVALISAVPFPLTGRRSHPLYSAHRPDAASSGGRGTRVPQALGGRLFGDHSDPACACTRNQRILHSGSLWAMTSPGTAMAVREGTRRIAEVAPFAVEKIPALGLIRRSACGGDEYLDACSTYCGDCGFSTLSRRAAKRMWPALPSTIGAVLRTADSRLDTDMFAHQLMAFVREAGVVRIPARMRPSPTWA